LIELIESWHSIQFNIEASLNDWQAWPRANASYTPMEGMTRMEALKAKVEDSERLVHILRSGTDDEATMVLRLGETIKVLVCRLD